jgi:hypothetical protein
MVDDLYTLYQRLLPENSSSPRADQPHRPPLAST